MKRRKTIFLGIMCNSLLMILLLFACTNQADDLVTSPTMSDPTVVESDPTIIQTEPLSDSLLPIISIETQSATPIASDEDYVSCQVSLSFKDSSFQFQSLTAGIRLRGNSTQQFEKKPYRLRFDEDIQLLGLGHGPSKSWLLLAEYVDLSMLRNKFTYDLSKDLLRHSFVSDTAFVEVILNGVSQGVYLVAEQTHVNPYRVNIDESGILDFELVDTGYLLELESDLERKNAEGTFMHDWFDIPSYSGNPNDIGWWNIHEYLTSHEVAFYVIKSDAKSIEQMTYIQNYMLSVYDAIYISKNEQDIVNLIDVESAVDMYLLQLLTNDYDNNFSSTFVYKDQGGKLVFGPPWDFDLSYGNHTLNPSTSTINMYHLLYALGELPWFKTLLIERWNNINTDNGLINQMKDQIHEYTETYTHYFESNHVMWQNTRTTGGWHFYAQSGIHSQADGATHFYNWLVERIAFIDTYLT